ncbi:alkaline phosphatase [Polaribacter filamentus]|jgi:alkaline phosphatase|uniref:Alkaline phosphatase n=1 Tax=Polaribacter filamentus TaxID=53483 RepID=A0A2S7KZ10_9FLAO|nr:alkaline phosphatase [Polaribacter filamentus]PQB07718.1 alkaline phosphatase [Polaribacter filamentus]
MNLKTNALILLVFLITSCVSVKTIKENNKPKNVILLISDGTGLSQISSAFYFKDTKANYARFDNIGLINTSSSKQDVTDSAAGATAFACGEKTFNGAIGVSNDSLALKNLVEIAHDNNIKTGLIATSSIIHATPASFFAHQPSRQMNKEIAGDLVKSSVDFFAAGGTNFFSNDLIKGLEAKDFYINKNGLDDFNSIKNYKKAGYLLAPNEMPKMSEGRGDFLSKATNLAIDFLGKDNKGFFIMAEGSQIDWGGHQNDGPYLVSELIDFDNTIGKVLDFAQKDGNTLVIVTSDHETGGFTLSGKEKTKKDGSKYRDYTEVGMSFSNGGHSATLIPVFAFGPGAEQFIGVYENNEIFDKILKVTNWKTKN